MRSAGGLPACAGKSVSAEGVDMKLTHLSLFSGIGGLDLAAEWAEIQTIGQCEWAEYPTKVLEKHWPDVPRWKDIRTLTKESFYEWTGRRTVDIISGGFPCQPFSVAGKQRGKEDDRYLWPEMVRVIKELRPAWIVGENVAGIVRMALPDILSELESCGYRTRTFLVPACAVGARHIRYRVAIVAYSESQFAGRLSVGEKTEESGLISGGKDVQHTDSSGCEKQYTSGEPDGQRFIGGSCNEGDVCNTAGQGLPDGTSQPMGGQGTPKQESERSDCNVPHTDNRSGDVWRDGEFSAVKETGRTGRDYGSGAQKYESRKWRSVESVLGGMADGLPAGMDRDFLINHYWDTEPDIPRIASGVEHRVDRLKCLGNAVVPQQFYPVFRSIAEQY